MCGRSCTLLHRVLRSFAVSRGLSHRIAHFFFDGLVGNKELVKPVIDAMSGNASEFDLMGCIAKGIADECKEVVEEYWDQIVFDIQMEAA